MLAAGAPHRHGVLLAVPAGAVTLIGGGKAALANGVAAVGAAVVTTVGSVPHVLKLTNC